MFNDNLKKERKKAGLTQEELATELHVVRQTISKWEKGLSVPDSISLEKMSEIFEVSIDNSYSSYVYIVKANKIIVRIRFL